MPDPFATSTLNVCGPAARSLSDRGDVQETAAPPSSEQVVVETLGSKPAKATHWSRASMAARSGLSKSTIGRIWRDFELKPHRTDGFKLSTDPQFVEKVVDVVGLYHNPPENAVVFCVDESRGCTKDKLPSSLPIVRYTKHMTAAARELVDRIKAA